MSLNWDAMDSAMLGFEREIAILDPIEEQIGYPNLQDEQYQKGGATREPPLQKKEGDTPLRLKPWGFLGQHWPTGCALAPPGVSRPL